MDGDFGEIRPEELKFMFEPNRQISCTVQLMNKSDRYVAFKVKTSHVKLYCVRPNNGIIKPGSTCEVKVTRQAQKVMPLPDVIIKEKFLFQRTFIPKSTAIGDIASLFSSKSGNKDINEKKLKVVVDGKSMVEVLKSKIEELDLRLREAEETISTLTKEKSDGDCKGKKTRPGVFIKCFNMKLV